MNRTLFFSIAAGLSLVLSLATAGPTYAAPTTYYVSGSGSDSNDGMTPSNAFRTIQRAANLTNPGDTVLIMDGEYGDTSGSGVLEINRSGAPGAPITYAAYPGHSPVLKPVTGWQGILVVGAAHIVIDGLEIYGNNENITLTEAQSHQNNGAYAPMNTNCIFIRHNKQTNVRSHHVTVRNSHVHHCPGSGIGTEYADYVTIENNVVHSNSWYTVYATSGISIYHPEDVDSFTGYKQIVRGNIVYDNETLIPWINCGCYSDGNGIIVDDTKHTQDKMRAYGGRTLVANNISFNNGGTGMHAFSSEHVDFVNNTAYLNSRSPHLNYANIAASESRDVFILNNISYVRAGEPTNSDRRNRRVTYDYNVYYGGLTPAVMGPNDIIADPQFVFASTDPALANFRLMAGSPAIDSGTSTKAPATDFAGAPRPQGAGFERGAYEYSGN